MSGNLPLNIDVSELVAVLRSSLTVRTAYLEFMEQIILWERNNNPAEAAKMLVNLEALSRELKSNDINLVFFKLKGMLALVYSDFNNALENFEKALASCEDDSPQTAAIKGAMLFPLAITRQQEKAEVCYREADTYFSKNKTSIYWADFMIQAGIYLGVQNQLDMAESCFNQAEKRFRQNKQMGECARVWMNIANIDILRENYINAEKYLQDALAIHEQQNRQALIASTRYSLAPIAYERGDFITAFQHLQKSQKIYDELNFEADLNRLKSHLVNLNIHLRRFPEALLLTEEIDAFLNDHKNAAFQRRNHANKSFVLAKLGKFAESNKLLTDLLSELEADGEDVTIFEILCQIADNYLELGDYNSCLLYCRKLDKYNLSGIFRCVRKDLIKAQALLKLKQFADCNEIIDSVLAAFSDFQASPMLAPALHLMAKVKHNMGQKKEALVWYRKAQAAFDTFRKPLTSIETWGIDLFSHHAKFYEEYFTFLLQENKRELSLEAFSCAESARTQILLEKIINQKELELRYDNEYKKEFLIKRQNIQNINNKLNSEDLTAKARTSTTAELNRLQKELEEAWGNVEIMQSNSNMPFSEQDKIISLPDIQKQLSDKIAILYFNVANDSITTYIITRDKWEVCHAYVSVDIIKNLLEDWTNEIEQCLIGDDFVSEHLETLLWSSEQVLYQFYQELLEDLPVFWRDKPKLIIIPHGILYEVPFQILKNADGFLFNEREISFSPSVAILATRYENTKPELINGLFVACPDPSLPFVGREMEQIVSLLDEGHRTLQNDQATRESLLKHCCEAGFIHIAGHGRFNAENPLFSYINLFDGPLYAFDIFPLKIKANLTVLSVCESGLNRVPPGNEILGFLRGFMGAGCPSLLLSTWPVSDKATEKLMTAFYTELKKGVSASRALQKSQRELAVSYLHAYYYGGFQLFTPIGYNE